MKIGGTAPAISGTATDAIATTSAQASRHADVAIAGSNATDVASSGSQDDAVQISPQGYEAASQGDGSDDGAVAGQSADPQTDTGANAQPMQSLVYGALGLDRPDQPPDPNRAYSIGRWLAAGITVGGIISLFI